MIHPIARILRYCLLSLTAMGAVAQTLPYKAQIQQIPQPLKQQMLQYTWNPRCPVPIEQLRLVTLRYWGFDHKAHQGQLVVNQDVASDVVDIFKTLYIIQFPIQRMELMEVFKGDDKGAMAMNNTSAFNCRPVTGKPGVFSQHSYGHAIDINPQLNPYVKDDEVLPENGRTFVNRDKLIPGIITPNSQIYQLFIQHGWQWGGDWHSLKDFQHFEKVPTKKDNSSELPSSTQKS
ncbi:MAG: M15 family metallopeptidase [Gammaproteobacteria bacterium]